MHVVNESVDIKPKDVLNSKLNRLIIDVLSDLK
jgi:hypothetical protein